MKNSRVFLSSMFALSLIFSLTASNSVEDVYACSCMQLLSPDEELPNFDAVFSGKVTDMDEKHPTDPIFSSTDPVFVTFDVDTVWKGEKKDTITVKTAQSSASCGFYFEEEQEYVVYASQYDDEYLEVSLCSRTGLLSDAIEDLQELGPGFAIKSENKLELLPPLKQFKSGIPTEQIQCKEGLQLVIKHDNTPACVKLDSILKLEKRGWTVLEASETSANNSSTVSTLYIDSELIDCMGLVPQKCMLIREDPESNWEFFYDKIEGFDYQLGYDYKIKVVITEIQNPPADTSSLKYTLVEVLEKIQADKDLDITDTDDDLLQSSIID